MCIIDTEPSYLEVTQQLLKNRGFSRNISQKMSVCAKHILSCTKEYCSSSVFGTLGGISLLSYLCVPEESRAALSTFD